ncbi:hypothetical protein FUMI01_20130 [Flavobacterium sp. UMI-01]|nr:hypothetical protein FUMI01_20130 [Flavobacterium sp. UMI-01]
MKKQNNNNISFIDMNIGGKSKPFSLEATRFDIKSKTIKSKNLQTKIQISPIKYKEKN